jgi:GAF domain-containing protein
LALWEAFVHEEPAGLVRAAEFARISGEMHAQPEEQPTLDRIVELAVESIPACDFCGVTLSTKVGVETPAASSPVVEKLDALQNELGEGPCLSAIWALDTYVIDDVGADERWPHWSPRAHELGIGSVLSLRLFTPTQVLGALNLYAAAKVAFDPTDVAVASIFARHAADALDVAQERNGLRIALRSRQLIGVAQGMLMQRYELTLDQSFEVLRRYSQDQNIRLRDLAEQLVADGHIPTDQANPFAIAEPG